MTTLSELVKIGWDRKALVSALNADHKSFESSVKAVVAECDDVETLKAAAIEFDEVSEFFCVGDKLEILMGDDVWDFAEEHDLAI